MKSMPPRCSLICPHLDIVSRWWADAKKTKGDWTVRCSLQEGVYIACHNELFNAIVLPPGKLNSSVSVGWQHRRYGSKIDPKEEIAEELMGALQKSSISYCFQEDERTTSGLISGVTVLMMTGMSPSRRTLGGTVLVPATWRGSSTSRI